MRGKAFADFLQTISRGITPAYAGKRPYPTSTTGEAWDHPRVCGEKYRERIKTCILTGSPPRMRGKVFSGGRTGNQAGITPAYAGKSRVVKQKPELPKDHPRVCGEKAMTSRKSASMPGSPPRMRGKDRPGGIRGRRGRITPAYAGKRERLRRSPSLSRDHPRVCGEKSMSVAVQTAAPGSPPRMRGKVPDLCFHKFRSGITPAYAGKRYPAGSSLGCE